MDIQINTLVAFIQGLQARIQKIEDKIESVEHRLELVSDALRIEITDLPDSKGADIEPQYVSSLSKMDELAKEEYYPFGRPLSREDEEG